MLRTKNTFFWIFLDWNSKKSLSYLKSTHSNLSKCKVWCKTKIHKFGTKNVSFGYFWTGSWKWYCYIWNQHPRIFLIANFREIMKMPKFGTKNASCGYFWARILKKLLSYLKSAPSNLSNCKILRKNKNS